MKYLKLILELLSSLFRWRANASDPEQDYQKRYKEWQKELYRLENEERKAKAKWQAVVSGALDGDAMELWAERVRIAAELSRHRTRQPKRKNN